MMNFSKIREFLKQNRQKLAVMSIYYISVLFLILWAMAFYMDHLSAVLIFLSSIIFYVCGGGFLRAIFIFILALSVMFQNHLVVNYSYPFSVIGREILLLTSETTSIEFATYLKVIRPEEYYNFIAVSVFCSIIFKFSPSQRSRVFPSVIAIFLLVFGMWHDVGEPVYAFKKEMNANDKIFTAYNSFTFNAKDNFEEEELTAIVLIGETHRYDYFDKYGYLKQYAPNLHDAKNSKNFFYYTDMVSGFHYTTATVPLVLTRKPALCDTRFFGEKSLITAFKEAGYYTYTVSYSRKTQPQDDAMNLLFLESNEYINHAETKDVVNDMDMFPVLEKILKDKTKKKKLIVIKMIGAHYLYEDRYPKDFEIFKPSYKSVYNDGEAAKNHDLLKNSYKNAIVYSSTVIDRLYKMVRDEKNPVLLSFISDHGTSLYDDGVNKYIGRAKGSHHIAYFITGNDNFWQTVDYNKKNNLKFRKDEKLTQEYFFETFLTLAKLKYFEYRPDLDITSDEFKAPTAPRTTWTQEGIETYDVLADEPILENDIGL